MKQTPKKYYSDYYDKSSKSLWIGELEQWMDSQYLIESCQGYGKKNNKYHLILILIIYRYPNKKCKNNPR